MTKQAKPRRVASIKTAIEYGRSKLDGRFSRRILYRLLKAKKLVAYTHGQSRLIDLDSIDRYVEHLPIQPYTPVENHHE